MKGEKFGLSDVELEKKIEKYNNIGRSYAGVVKWVSKHNASRFIKNGDNDMRSYLLHQLIKRARKGEYIKIYSDDMEEALCGDDCVYNTLINALDKGVKLKMVLKNKISDDDLGLFKGLDNVEIYKQRCGRLRKNPTFLLSGDLTFYIAKPHNKKDFENNKITGDVNFNNKRVSGKIYKTFSTLIKGSDRVL